MSALEQKRSALEDIERYERMIVDQLDSKRRPSFVLTPSLRVVVYRGSNAGGAREGLVAELPTSERSRSVAQF